MNRVRDRRFDRELSTKYVGRDVKRRMPKHEFVMIGATGMFYDCPKNRWFQATLPSDEPDLGKHPSYNLGDMYDAGRKLVWAVDTNSRVYALRLELSSLKVKLLQ